MNAFFATGAVADVVLLVMLGELVILTTRGRDLRAVVLALLPGALLVLAARAALVGADWKLIAVPFALALPAHLADLQARGWLGPRSADKRLRAVK